MLVESRLSVVELRLDDRMIGEAAADRIMGNEWDVPYAPGRIEAIARRGGRIVARAAHETTGAAVALRLTPARTVMAGDGEDVQPVTVDAVDARGRHVPTANVITDFAVAGATIIGLGNGDNNSHEPEKGSRRSLFNGLAQLIVQADAGGGAITIRATAAGLRPATLRIDRVAVAPRPSVPPTPAVTRIDAWRRSPTLATKPAPDLAPADGDNNSSASVRAGTPTPAEAAPGWRVYRATAALRRRVAAASGTITFTRIAGRAELWVDGRRAAVKSDAAPGPLIALLPAGLARRDRALVVEAAAGVPSGLHGPAEVTAA